MKIIHYKIQDTSNVEIVGKLEDMLYKIYANLDESQIKELRNKGIEVIRVNIPEGEYLISFKSSQSINFQSVPDVNVIYQQPYSVILTVDNNQLDSLRNKINANSNLIYNKLLEAVVIKMLFTF